MTTELIDSEALPPVASSNLPLVAYEAYQRSRANIFPSTESLRWFERQHRAELHERGALCMPAGRKFVVADRFDQAVMEIGLRLAAARAA